MEIERRLWEQHRLRREVQDANRKKKKAMKNPYGPEEDDSDEDPEEDDDDYDDEDEGDNCGLDDDEDAEMDMMRSPLGVRTGSTAFPNLYQQLYQSQQVVKPLPDPTPEHIQGLIQDMYTSGFSQPTTL